MATRSDVIIFYSTQQDTIYTNIVLVTTLKNIENRIENYTFQRKSENFSFLFYTRFFHQVSIHKTTRSFLKILFPSVFIVAAQFPEIISYSTKQNTIYNNSIIFTTFRKYFY